MTSSSDCQSSLSVEACSQAKAEFLRDFPQFASTHVLDELRAVEYARLDRLGHIYLDYTGGGLYADSQVQAHKDLLLNHVFGNPHSSNPTSLSMTHHVEQARAYVLEFFNAGKLPLALRPGMMIGALSFEPLTGPADRPYNRRQDAKYRDQQGAVASRIDKD